MSDKDFTIAALLEANEELGGILKRYRVTIAHLRRTNSELRRLKNIQIQNDHEFKALCHSDIVLDV